MWLFNKLLLNNSNSFTSHNFVNVQYVLSKYSILISYSIRSHGLVIDMAVFFLHVKSKREDNYAHDFSLI